jgi:hypothetical protein
LTLSFSRGAGAKPRVTQPRGNGVRAGRNMQSPPIEHGSGCAGRSPPLLPGPSPPPLLVAGTVKRDEICTAAAGSTSRGINFDVFGSPYCNVARLLLVFYTVKHVCFDVWAVIRCHGMGYCRVESRIPNQDRIDTFRRVHLGTAVSLFPDCRRWAPPSSAPCTAVQQATRKFAIPTSLPSASDLRGE